MIDGDSAGVQEQVGHRELSDCGPDGVGSGVSLKTQACPWGARKRSRYQWPLSQQHWRSTGPEQSSTHSCTVQPHLHSDPLLYWRHEGKQREGETDRDKEAASHLGGHLEPLPQLPQTHHMFGYGKTNPGSGSHRGWERRGLSGSHWDGRDTHNDAKTGEKAGWEEPERYNKMTLGKDRAGS